MSSTAIGDDAPLSDAMAVLVVAVNYGRYASDHWTVDDVIVQVQRSAAT